MRRFRTWLAIGGTDGLGMAWLLALCSCGGGGGPIRPIAQLPPREATYVGSDECQRCHLAQHGIWKQTFHARMIRPINEPGALMAPVLGRLAGLNVVFTLGSHFRQRFIFLEGGEYWVAKGQYLRATNDASSLVPARDKKWKHGIRAFGKHPSSPGIDCPACSLALPMGKIEVCLVKPSAHS